MTLFQGDANVLIRDLRLGCMMLAMCACSRAYAEEYQLPPEVTPQLRAACETDVRRLCIGANPSVSKVKVCVASKFLQLGKRCQLQLALAGFKP